MYSGRGGGGKKIMNFSLKKHRIVQNEQRSKVRIKDFVWPISVLALFIAAKSTKTSVNIFDVSGGGGGLERNVQLTFLVGKIDV